MRKTRGDTFSHVIGEDLMAKFSKLVPPKTTARAVAIKMVEHFVENPDVILSETKNSIPWAGNHKHGLEDVITNYITEDYSEYLRYAHSVELCTADLTLFCSLNKQGDALSYRCRSDRMQTTIIIPCKKGFVIPAKQVDLITRFVDLQKQFGTSVTIQLDIPYEPHPRFALIADEVAFISLDPDDFTTSIPIGLRWRRAKNLNIANGYNSVAATLVCQMREHKFLVNAVVYPTHPNAPR